MTLSMQDAYALRCAISLQDVPSEVKLSPVLDALLSTLDWKNNPEHRQLLEDMVAAQNDMMRQVMAIDPLSDVPEDDNLYIANYIKQVTTVINAPVPDTSKTNGSTQLLTNLHKANQLNGPAAAHRLWEQTKTDKQKLAEESPSLTPLHTFDEFTEKEPIAYLDKDNIIQEHDITAIVGQPGSGKSFWTLAKLAELADKMSVVYIAAEGLNPDRLLAMRKARTGLGIPHTTNFSNNFQITDQPLDLTKDQTVKAFVQQIALLKPKVIAIDTFATCTPGIDENSSKDMQPILNRIREHIIRVLDCAVLLVHHTTKDGRSFRGSSALRGNVANMYYLTKIDDNITLKPDKQRDAKPAKPRHYRFVTFFTRIQPQTDEKLYSIAILPAENVIDNPTIELSSKQRQVLRALETHENGLQTRHLQDITGIAKATLWRHINKLATVNYIKIGAKGKPVRITKEGCTALADKSKL